MAFLTCNFAPPTEGKPALLTHDDVLTLFHEFGHGLHHLLTEIALPSIGGIDGVEWDAVELPSQFMENFGWNREALDLFARHYQTGEPLPDELFQRMLAARHFHAGLFLVRQLEFALFDFLLHRDYDPAAGRPHPGRARAGAPGSGRAAPAGLAALPARLQPHLRRRLRGRLLQLPVGGTAQRRCLRRVRGSRRQRRQRDRRRHRRALPPAKSWPSAPADPALDSFVAFRGRKPEPEALLRSHGLA